MFQHYIFFVPILHLHCQQDNCGLGINAKSSNDSGENRLPIDRPIPRRTEHVADIETAAAAKNFDRFGWNILFYIEIRVDWQRKVPTAVYPHSTPEAREMPCTPKLRAQKWRAKSHRPPFNQELRKFSVDSFYVVIVQKRCSGRIRLASTGCPSGRRHLTFNSDRIGLFGSAAQQS